MAQGQTQTGWLVEHQVSTRGAAGPVVREGGPPPLRNSTDWPASQSSSSRLVTPSVQPLGYPGWSDWKNWILWPLRHTGRAVTRRAAERVGCRAQGVCFIERPLPPSAPLAPTDEALLGPTARRRWRLTSAHVYTYSHGLSPAKETGLAAGYAQGECTAP